MRVPRGQKNHANAVKGIKIPRLELNRARGRSVRHVRCLHGHFCDRPRAKRASWPPNLENRGRERAFYGLPVTNGRLQLENRAASAFDSCFNAYDLSRSHRSTRFAIPLFLVEIFQQLNALTSSPTIRNCENRDILQISLMCFAFAAGTYGIHSNLRSWTLICEDFYGKLSN